jgi:putative transposase
MEIVDPLTVRKYVRKRRVRCNEQGSPRELTFSCYKQFQFLARERTREWFRDALEKARAEFGFQLWAYVIMPEHVHLLVNPGVGVDDDQVSRFLQSLKEPVARKAVAYLKHASPKWLERTTVREGQRVRHRFWQPGGGYDRNVLSTEALRAMIDYIHANPVRRGLVSHAEDWEWSSARWFAGLRPARIEMNAEVLLELANA